MHYHPINVQVLFTSTGNRVCRPFVSDGRLRVVICARGASTNRVYILSFHLSRGPITVNKIIYSTTIAKCGEPIGSFSCCFRHLFLQLAFCCMATAFHPRHQATNGDLPLIQLSSAAYACFFIYYGRTFRCPYFVNYVHQLISRMVEYS